MNSHRDLPAILDSVQISPRHLPKVPEIALYLMQDQVPEHHLQQQDYQRLMEAPPYWAFCWGGGQALARWILDNPAVVQGRRVVDFGAGSGVVAIACRIAGAREVIACDIDADALLSCEANAELNKVNYRIHGDLFAFNEDLDLLIAADVLYDKANLPLLDVFRNKANEELVADSRVKNFDFPPYQAIGRHESFTVPDLDELDEFRWVNLYRS